VALGRRSGFIEKNPDIYKKIIELRPNGPLEISYMRGAAGRVVPCRYDFILADKSFEVKKVEYLYQESVASGSDHSLVRTTFF
jgi:endonuclease/exonuclease/phosphatase family metal-dependent hydrolase